MQLMFNIVEEQMLNEIADFNLEKQLNECEELAKLVSLDLRTKDVEHNVSWELNCIADFNCVWKRRCSSKTKLEIVQTGFKSWLELIVEHFKVSRWKYERVDETWMIKKWKSGSHTALITKSTADVSSQL